MRRKQNGDFNVWYFKRFLFGMSSNVPTVKVRVLTSDFKFWMGVKWISVSTFLIRICSIFYFQCLTNFAKGIKLFCKASLWRVLLCKHPIYTSKSDRYIQLLWAKFELERLLIIFIYFNSKFKAQMRILAPRDKTFKRISMWFILVQIT